MYYERLEISINSLIHKVPSLLINIIQQRFKKKPTDQQPTSIHYNILINLLFHSPKPPPYSTEGNLYINDCYCNNKKHANIIKCRFILKHQNNIQVNTKYSNTSTELSLNN